MNRSEYQANVHLNPVANLGTPYTGNLTLEPLPVVHLTLTRWEQSATSVAEKRQGRIDDIKAANRSSNCFLKSAAFRALNNLLKIGV